MKTVREDWYISDKTIQFINSHTWQFKRHTHSRNGGEMNFQWIVREVPYMSTYLCSGSTVAFFPSFPAPFFSLPYINSVRRPLYPHRVFIYLVTTPVFIFWKEFGNENIGSLLSTQTHTHLLEELCIPLCNPRFVTFVLFPVCRIGQQRAG